MERLLAESDEQRRARLEGKEAEFHYKAAAASPGLPARWKHGGIND
jgi:hypothetical protein